MYSKKSLATPGSDAPDTAAAEYVTIPPCDCTFERYHRLSKYFLVFILGAASIVMVHRCMDAMRALTENRMTYPGSKE